MTVLKAEDGATATPLAFVRPVTPQYLCQGPRQIYSPPATSRRWFCLPSK